MAMLDLTHFFWQVAEPFLLDEAVSKSTMMGFPCLRVNGHFFASVNHRTGDLVIKLPTARVQALINAGEGEAFAPNGRRFREWVAITRRDAQRWEELLAEAQDFVAGQGKA